MAHLWIESNHPDNGAPEACGWRVLPLTEGALNLGDALLLRSRHESREVWFVMSATPSGVRLNGVPLAACIRVLRDRDELHIGGWGRVFFSTESLARVEPFPGSERPARCPRSHDLIEIGTDAVRCPNCGVWYHQCPEFPCWTYAANCALCPQPTALDSGYSFNPEDL